MSRNEIYIALVLLTLLLVSVVWKHELAYRRSLLSDQKPVEIDIPSINKNHLFLIRLAKVILGRENQMAMVGLKNMVII